MSSLRREGGEEGFIFSYFRSFGFRHIEIPFPRCKHLLPQHLSIISFYLLPPPRLPIALFSPPFHFLLPLSPLTKFLPSQSLPQIRLAYQKKMLGIPSSDSDVEWSDHYYGERSSWDDMQRQQLELSDGGTVAGSARERKSGSRAGGVGRGSPIGRGGRGSSRQR